MGMGSEEKCYQLALCLCFASKVQLKSLDLVIGGTRGFKAQILRYNLINGVDKATILIILIVWI